MNEEAMRKIDDVFLQHVHVEIAGTVAMLFEECHNDPAKVLLLASELNRQSMIIMKSFYNGDTFRAALHLNTMNSSIIGQK